MQVPKLNINGDTIPTPILKWAGSKRWLVPVLKDLWHNHQSKHTTARLVEPFAGSLAVSLGVQPEQALINDLNFSLINLYRWVRRGLTAPITPYNSAETYYEYRDLFNQHISTPALADGKIAAYLFYYLNRTGYRGLCRFSQKGHFNVPYGKYPTVEYLIDFMDLQKEIRDWKFTSKDFSKLKIEANDFVYADPPYDTPFTAFSKESFNWKDQVRLVEWLNALAERGSTVVISNQRTDRIVDLYKKANFKIKTIRAPRRIGHGKNGEGSEVSEVLAAKNL